ncbi:MAG: amidophosphoribosyltransferase [Bacteroidaceae bacterium]|nr:amidophosphoribosyltransferase [Bacteroidaceae bacterium]MBO7260899.1 amidophosphoribosyltransferase [Bacteroidaceae bacterium]
MEPLRHECGMVMVRLLKPMSYYRKKYNSIQYGLSRLYLMMEKQKNRGQEGAGIAVVKMKANPGEDYMFRERALGSGAISEIFDGIQSELGKATQEQLADDAYIMRRYPFIGDLYLGHLRYSSGGRNSISDVHPFLRRNNWRAKNLALCGNFTITNEHEVFEEIISKGQHPRSYTSTYFMLEQVGHRLDREVERVFKIAEEKGLKGVEITNYIDNNVDMANVLSTSSPIWDGGYVIGGITGSGESFAIRDPWGIRTAFWYKDEEIIVVASERPAIQTSLNVEADKVHELQPGQAIIINKKGEMRLEQIIPQKAMLSCSFERVYFSRGNDTDIYLERKELGRQLVEPVLNAIDNDVDHAVFSFIPNTAEVASFGLVEGFEQYLNKKKIEDIKALGDHPKAEDIERILSKRVRNEKVAWKDIKLRTFITAGSSRNELAAHVYDITYGSLEKNVDNLVIIDDSIVRGTTLRESIIYILDRLSPKRIVIVSSSPQVRYPDYYGIDMSSMDHFIAFKAALALLEERGMWHLVTDVYCKCREQLTKAPEERINCVKEIYAPFTEEEISDKIVELLTPPNVKAEVKIVYQTLEGLHKACPNHPGDWYFSGDFPTPGGTLLVNKAFIDYYEQYNK